MPRANINHVVVTGNLTADPELRHTSSGVSICELRIAVNSTFKKDGNWESKANYFAVSVWGKSGENCVKFLQKGSGVAIDGRLEFQSWKSADDPKKTNSRVIIVANTVEFIGKTKSNKESASSEGSTSSNQEDIPF